MLHLVGHSLGGHMCGIIGRNIIEKSQKQFKLKRYTISSFIYTFTIIFI